MRLGLTIRLELWHRRLRIPVSKMILNTSSTTIKHVFLTFSANEGMHAVVPYSVTLYQGYFLWSSSFSVSGIIIHTLFEFLRKCI